MISIHHLTHRFDALTALDDVSLEIATGEFFGLLGPNGAGKSTLMSLLCGYRRPTAGEIRYDDRRFVAGHLAMRTAIGYVPQNIALYPELDAVANLRTFGRLYGLKGKRLAERIEQVLAAVELRDRRREPVAKFSGGMQRRLNIAAALLHEPTILLCDEPTVGVDPQSRNAIFELLVRLNRAGTTVIYSTHYMEEAERLCSRIAIIDHGKILALGTLDELLTSLPFEEEIRFPASAATAPLLPALRDRGELVTSEGVHRFRLGADYSLSAFFGLTESHGLPARLFTNQRPTLEAVFLHLTGRRLRE